jgi:hypothetical protein
MRSTTSLFPETALPNAAEISGCGVFEESGAATPVFI